MEKIINDVTFFSTLLHAIEIVKNIAQSIWSEAVQSRHLFDTHYENAKKKIVYYLIDIFSDCLFTKIIEKEIF